jgi:RNA polymerase sigma-70 factor (ECF subfamily)
VSVSNDDSELIDAAQGDSEAFGLLYERYVGRIYNYIYYRTGNSFEAEDLTARVFMRAHNHIGRFKNMGLPFSAWLYRIAHNLVANWHRDNSRQKEIPLDDSTRLTLKSDHPESQVISQQEFDRLLQEIRRLSADRQQLLILKFVERMSNSEIGVIIGKSEGAVKSLYHRTLTELRDALEQKASRLRKGG